MLHYEQVFGIALDTRESKCCCRVKGEQVITLQLAQQVKIKNINVVPRQLFFLQCKAIFS